MAIQTPTQTAYPADLVISIPPFEHRFEGEDVIITNQARSTFLCVPREALDILNLLAAGRSLGETRAEYARLHGETPDLDDFLDTLRAEGFFDADSSAAPKAARTYHFENLPVDVARRFASPPVLITTSALIGLGLLACALDPGLLPPPTALVFPRDQVGLLGLALLVSLVTVFLHELAHLVAARAAGAPSRLGVGNRLWIVVAETDMTGVWLASRRQRCLAFLAGPVLDLALSAPFVLVLFADRHHWLGGGLDAGLVAFLRAALFVCLARLLWQFEFFVPTDFYYVIATLTGCRNLMQDTQTFLVNQAARVLPWLRSRDQSSVPERELRVVRWFSLVWLAGRGVTFVSLFWITLPVLTGYGVMLARSVGGDTQAVQPLTNGPLMPFIAVALQVVGLLMWMRGVLRSRRVVA